MENEREKDGMLKSEREQNVRKIIANGEIYVRAQKKKCSLLQYPPCWSFSCELFSRLIISDLEIGFVMAVSWISSYSEGALGIFSLRIHHISLLALKGISKSKLCWWMRDKSDNTRTFIFCRRRALHMFSSCRASTIRSKLTCFP